MANEQSYYIEYLKKTSRFPQSIYHKAKHETVRAVFSSLSPGSRVLDAGCGVGHITGAYTDRYSIFGIDEQESTIQYCRENWKGTYLKGDLRKIPFEDNFFDAVLFLDAIEHIEQPLMALRELARVLKPGSPFLACTMNYSSPLWFILEHTWHRFLGGNCKPYCQNVHPTQYTEVLLREHCQVFFKEIYLRKRIMNMELFYFGKK